MHGEIIINKILYGKRIQKTNQNYNHSTHHSLGFSYITVNCWPQQQQQDLIEELTMMTSETGPEFGDNQVKVEKQQQEENSDQQQQQIINKLAQTIKTEEETEREVCAIRDEEVCDDSSRSSISSFSGQNGETAANKLEEKKQQLNSQQVERQEENELASIRTNIEQDNQDLETPMMIENNTIDQLADENEQQQQQQQVANEVKLEQLNDGVSFILFIFLFFGLKCERNFLFHNYLSFESNNYNYNFYLFMLFEFVCGNILY